MGHGALLQRCRCTLTACNVISFPPSFPKWDLLFAMGITLFCPIGCLCVENQSLLVYKSMGL